MLESSAGAEMRAAEAPPLPVLLTPSPSGAEQSGTNTCQGPNVPSSSHRAKAERDGERRGEDSFLKVLSAKSCAEI